MGLHNWLKNGWRTEHRPHCREISELLGAADRDLIDCQAAGLSPDWQFNIAYNSALLSATAALAAAGYRAVREAHHYRVIQSLAHTIRSEPKIILTFDRFRKKRNIVGYERMGIISDQEAREMLDLAGNLRMDVIRWIGDDHSELLGQPLRSFSPGRIVGCTKKMARRL
jgi:hypothetical protein